jgi:hypothetical protein
LAKKARGQIRSGDSEKIKNLIAQKEQHKKNKRGKRNRKDSEKINSNDTFAFIAGYTNGRAAYEITHEEWAVFNVS